MLAAKVNRKHHFAHWRYIACELKVFFRRDHEKCNGNDQPIADYYKKRLTYAGSNDQPTASGVNTMMVLRAVGALSTATTKEIVSQLRKDLGDNVKLLNNEVAPGQKTMKAWEVGVRNQLLHGLNRSQPVYSFSKSPGKLGVFSLTQMGRDVLDGKTVSQRRSKPKSQGKAKRALLDSVKAHGALAGR